MSQTPHGVSRTAAPPIPAPVSPDLASATPSATRWTRRAGAIVMGFALGFLLVIAMIEFLRSLGALTAFQYQGY